MAVRIEGDRMTLTVGDEIVATARFRQHAAADGSGAWIVSTHPGRLFSRNQAITALTLAERIPAGFGDYDPFAHQHHDRAGGGGGRRRGGDHLVPACL